MHKAWNPQLKQFGQSYEETDVLDSAVLIMPLVFFMQGVSSASGTPDDMTALIYVHSPTLAS